MEARGTNPRLEGRGGGFQKEDVIGGRHRPYVASWRKAMRNPV
jgi:hypothetical protein